MKVLMRKTGALLLSLLMVISSMTGVTVFAAGTDDYQATDASVVIDGANAKTVTIGFVTNASVNLMSVYGIWDITENEGTGYFKLSSIQKNENMPFAGIDDVVDISDGRFQWYDGNFVPVSFAVGETLVTATYEVDANTPVGTYTIDFKLAEIIDETFFTTYVDKEFTATVTVTADPSTCAHTGGTATCVAQAVCTVCGTPYGSVDLENHTNIVDVAAKPAATCKDEGWDAYKQCKDCEQLFAADGVTKLVAVPTVTGEHNYGTLVPAVEEKHTETELEPAVAAHYQCSVCEKYFTEAKDETTLEELTGDKPAHNFNGEWLNNATKHWKECSVDGCTAKAEEAEHVYDGEEDMKCNVCNYDRSCKHDTARTHFEAKPATCTAVGNVEYWECECGQKFDAATEGNEIADAAIAIDPDNHTGSVVEVEDDKYIVGEADCTTAATYYKSYDCCGAATSETFTTGAPLGHDYEPKFDENEHWEECSRCPEATAKEAHKGGTATCEELAVCDVCEQPYGELAAHTIPETSTPAVSADCENAGNVEYWTCTVCEKNFADAEGSTELESVVVPALGHDYKDFVVTEEMSCFKDGIKTGTCSVCGKTITETIPAPNAHTWGDWVTTIEPTEDAEGEEKRVCSVCGAIETNVLEKLDSGFMEEWYWTMVMLHNKLFNIEAEAEEGGVISPAGVTKVHFARDAKYTITPDEGYEIEAVYVDGVDVGAVSTYRFDRVTKDHTIYAVFAEIEEEPVIEESLYDDVDADDWFYDDVVYVSENGLMNGTGDNLFSPDVNTTRAMIVTILWRLEGEADAESAGFTDVAADKWYAEAVDWAAANGIVNGFGDGTFGPEKNITREQVMAILHRYAAFKGWDEGVALAMIAQYDCSVWAENDVNWADMNGLLDNLGVDVTDMTAEADRAEIAAYFTRFCLNVAE